MDSSPEPPEKMPRFQNFHSSPNGLKKNQSPSPVGKKTLTYGHHSALDEETAKISMPVHQKAEKRKEKSPQRKATEKRKETKTREKPPEKRQKAYEPVVSMIFSFFVPQFSTYLRAFLFRRILLNATFSDTRFFRF